MSGQHSSATDDERADSTDRPQTKSSQGPVVVRTPERRLSGRALDVRGRTGTEIDTKQLVAAIRHGRDDSEDGPDERSGQEGVDDSDEDTREGPVGDSERTAAVDRSVAVACPDPGPAHEYVGLVESGMALRVRTALAAGARSRGLSAPQDEDLASVRTQLADLTVPDADAAAARERLAGTESAVAAGRERVATIRGRLQAARDAGRETDDLREELRAAARELSEIETERAAAREALERAERRAREARDARERRRRLEDRAANLARAARSHLVDAVREEFATAVAAVPGPDRAGESQATESPFDVDPVSAALAVGRVAQLRAPVVLAVGRFASPDAAADWLDAPVVRV
jgi:hypothetical protein